LWADIDVSVECRFHLRDKVFRFRGSLDYIKTNYKEDHRKIQGEWAKKGARSVPKGGRRIPSPGMWRRVDIV
jgi:hypothetical protein